MMRPSEPTPRSSRGLARPALALALLAVTGPAFAQSVDLLGDAKSLRSKPQPLRVEATLTADRTDAGATAVLSVSATPPDGFYLYSTDPGFAGRTRIELLETPGLEPAGEFTADHPPKRQFDSALGQEIEKYTGQVVWSRPMRIVDPSAAKVIGKLSGQYCSAGIGGLCVPTTVNFVSVLTKAAPPAAGPPVAAAPASAASASAGANFSAVETPEKSKGQPGPATLRFTLSPENAKPGDAVTLSVQMALGDGWHTYSLDQPAGPGALPTVFDLKEAKGLTPIGPAFVADRDPVAKTLDTEDGLRPIAQHDGTVTWSRPFRVDAAGYGVAGSVKYLVCSGSECLPPRTVGFRLGDLTGAGPVPSPLAAETADPLAEVFAADEAGEANLLLYLGLAFVGGLILNVMPCVLPVVAIKVMSFVHQAGEDRGRVFLLNLVYAAGVVAVFLFLAALASLPEWFGWLFEALGLETGSFGWGGLFQSDTFNVVMACLVFAFALSLLGAFEIPIPGMVGSAAGASQREGLTGAFFTGVFATLLATPCTGPFMGTALAWSVKQPAAVTFLVWATMGLGMASPYLVFGLVPGAVKLLPKPGMWMVKFKEFAGLVLMATVVFLMTSVKTTYLIPLLVGLVGIALALWLFGVVQPSANAAKRRIVSAAGVALGLGIGAFAYGLTAESRHTLAWEPFSTERLNALRSEGKPILIDFTASWCFNCKTNEKLALNTAETKAFVTRHGVTPLVADFSGESAEIKQWLDRFGAIGIPLTVIFPAGRPNDPIVLDGVFTQGTLLEKLDEAVKGPAVAKAAGRRTAAR